MGAPLGLLERLQLGRSAIGIVTVHGVELGLRVLSEEDYLQAQMATERAMQAAGMTLSVSTAEAFESEKASQLLCRALCDPLSGKALCDSAQALRAALSREEHAWIIEAYLDHERRFSPSERTLDEEAFAALLEEVKKKPLTPRLNDSSTATLRRLIASLACPPAS